MPTFVGLRLNGVKSSSGGTGEGQASGPLQACHRRVQPPFCFLLNIFTKSDTQPEDPGIHRAQQALPPPRRRGQNGSRGCFFLCNPISVPESLNSFTATQGHSGNPAGAEEEIRLQPSESGKFQVTPARGEGEVGYRRRMGRRRRRKSRGCFWNAEG